MTVHGFGRNNDGQGNCSSILQSYLAHFSPQDQKNKKNLT